MKGENLKEPESFAQEQGLGEKEKKDDKNAVIEKLKEDLEEIKTKSLEESVRFEIYVLRSRVKDAGISLKEDLKISEEYLDKLEREGHKNKAISLFEDVKAMALKKKGGKEEGENILIGLKNMKRHTKDARITLEDLGTILGIVRIEEEIERLEQKGCECIARGNLEEARKWSIKGHDVSYEIMNVRWWAEDTNVSLEQLGTNEKELALLEKISCLNTILKDLNMINEVTQLELREGRVKIDVDFYIKSLNERRKRIKELEAQYGKLNPLEAKKE